MRAWTGKDPARPTSALDGHGATVANEPLATVETRLLQGAGGAVTRVGTVRGARAALAERSWDLVVVGLVLPDGSGGEMAREAAVQVRLAAVVIFSGDSDLLRRLEPLPLQVFALHRSELAAHLVPVARLAIDRAARLVSSPADKPASSRARQSVAGFSERFRLTPRQDGIFAMLVGGLAPKEIAGRLSLSHITIRRHAEDIYRKCGVRSQREMLALFARTMMLADGPQSDGSEAAGGAAAPSATWHRGRVARRV